MHLFYSLMELFLLIMVYHSKTTNCASEHIEVKEGAVCESYLYRNVDKCMPGKSGISGEEIHNWQCEGGDDGHWVRYKEKDQICSGKNSKCFCERVVWDEFDNYNCRCVDATKHPDFPTTGILKWTEKVRFWSDYKSAWWNAETHVEIHRNRDGHYLKKYADYDWENKNENETLPYEYKFEIRIPIENGKFIKITGNVKDKNCQINIAKNRGSRFDTLWHAKSVHTLSENIQKSETISTQVWERKLETEIVFESTWRMEYNSTRDRAIPVSHHYEKTDYSDNYKIIDRHFKFTDLPAHRISFDVNDYCLNDG